MNIRSACCEISVIICTYNRALMLRDALASLAKQEDINKADYEVLVVDNGSADNTQEIVTSFTEQLQIRYIMETELGQSNARNRGIREARGRLLVFTDDDVLFSPRWLVELLEGARRWADACAFGGCIKAKWEVAKPRWFWDKGRFSMNNIIVQFDPPIPEGPLKKLSFVGCNMAFRSSAFEMYGSFLPQLGLKGCNMARGEEYELFDRITAKGGEVVYLPKAFLYHRVPETRAVKSYYIRWMKGGGITLAQRIISGERLSRFPHFLRCPIGMWKELVLAVSAWILALATFRWRRLFVYRLPIIRFWSLFRERWQRL
jgi:glycosyltransferase involved in cell wall biosynthesis